MKPFFMLLFLIGVCLVPSILMAGPVGIAVHDSTFASGATVYIPVRVDTTVTDSNVVSYQIDLSYSSSVMLIDSVIMSGTMTNGWLTTFHLYPGRITIAGSSGTALTGKGILFYLRAKMFVFYSLNYASVTFNSAALNEGKPATVTRNGNFTITASPIITVAPDNVVLTVGDAQQFSVSGGTAPYTWSTTNSSIATINSSGILTAVHAGFCRVVAVDQNHVVDTSQQVEVRAYKLSIRDTSYFQGQTFLLPIYISDLSLVNIYSGTFTLTFNQSILQATGTSQTGTLLASYGAPVVKITSSTISVAFAGTTRLNGIGNSVLMYIQFQVSNSNPYSTSIQFSNFLMNETITGTNRDGNFTVIPHPTFTVSPSTGTIVYGDSLQFSVGSGAVQPVVWSVSDTSRASISSAGWLKVKKGGTVVVSATDAVGGTGSSGNVSLYDMRVQVLNASGAAGDTVSVNVQLSTAAFGFSSFQFSLSYSQPYITPIDIVGGALYQNWSVVAGNPSPGTVNIAGASTTTVLSQGILLTARFRITPGTGNGSYAINLANLIFNEGNPIGLVSNGNIIVTNPTDVREYRSGIPNQFALEQNYPNPFNPSTLIRYDLPKSEQVVVKVYDIVGREISTLVDSRQEAGFREVQWNASNLPSGIYFYRISAGTFTDTKKTMLVK